jgi:cadmium resistance protein CadD (predicted permease)
MFAILGLAIVLFVSTNIDDIFVLVGFLADPRFRLREILVGQYIGMATLVGASVAASLSSSFFPRSYIGLLAIIPILVGAKSLFDQTWRAPEKNGVTGPEHSGRGHRRSATVAIMTIVNGGDNIGIYAPAFAIHSKREIALIIFIFAVMIAVWCLCALWIVNHPRLGAPIRRYGRVAASVVLIILGVIVMVQAGTIAFLQGVIARSL